MIPSLMLLALLGGALLALRHACRLAARAAHEVRGPLTVALLSLDGMVARDEVAGDAAAGLQHQLQRARLALDDLAAARRVARAPDRLEPVNGHELLTQIAGAWRPVAEARGVLLRVAMPEADGGAVLVDRTRVAQAVGNLVGNALEHGAGPVELRGRFGGGRLRIEVRDAGAGLHAPLRVLSRRPRHGRGHGLAIAAGIAERHGGRLVAAPSAGGAVVAIELPARAPWPGGPAPGGSSRFRDDGPPPDLGFGPWRWEG